MCVLNLLPLSFGWADPPFLDCLPCQLFLNETPPASCCALWTKEFLRTTGHFLNYGYPFYSPKRTSLRGAQAMSVAIKTTGPISNVQGSVVRHGLPRNFHMTQREDRNQEASLRIPCVNQMFPGSTNQTVRTILLLDWNQGGSKMLLPIDGYINKSGSCQLDLVVMAMKGYCTFPRAPEPGTSPPRCSKIAVSTQGTIYEIPADCLNVPTFQNLSTELGFYFAA